MHLKEYFASLEVSKHRKTSSPIGMANGAGRPASTRPCATRLSRTGRVTGQPAPAPFRGGSKRVDPSRVNGTNRVGKNFPDPPSLFFFMSNIIIWLLERKISLRPLDSFLIFLKGYNGSKMSRCGWIRGCLTHNGSFLSRWGLKKNKKQI